MDGTLTCPRTKDALTEDGVQVQRCRDPQRIEKILREEYFDDPIRRFPPRLIRAVARDWFATSPELYLMTVEVDGAYAGFIFGHTIGPRLWRQWARQVFPRHSLSLAWVWLRICWQRLATRRRGTRPQPVASERRRVPKWVFELPCLDRPFRWSSERGSTGYCELLLVHEQFRGKNLGPHLIRGMCEEMARQGVTLMESHIDAHNYAALWTALNAGWEAFRTTGKDWYLRFVP